MTRKAYLWLLGVLALSGLALTLLYVPVTTPAASAPPARPGWTMGPVWRGVHFWAAQLAVLAILAHFVRAHFVKTSRRLIGRAAGLFVLTVLLAFTGYLLPWDALEYRTLMRLYVLHVLLLPLLLYPLAAYARRTREGGTPLAPTPISL